MQIHLEASAGTIALATALRTAPRRLRQVQGQWTLRLAEQLVNRAKTQYRTAPGNRTTATATAVRSGHLRRAYAHTQPRETATGYTFDFGVVEPGPDGKALEYAATQEFGAVIKPKHGRFLTIPIGPASNEFINALVRGRSALTEAGVLRASARDMPNLFRGRGRLRSDVLYQRQGDDIVPMFLLRTRVTIPARPALLPSAEDVLPRWAEQFTTALDQASTADA